MFGTVSAIEYTAVNGAYSSEQSTQQYIFFALMIQDLIKPEFLQSFCEIQQGFSNFSLSLMIKNLGSCATWRRPEIVRVPATGEEVCGV